MMARRWVILAALLLIPVAAVAALPPGGTFLDDDGNIHEGAIEAIFAAGITVGCGPELYCPANPVSRAEMATFLIRALNEDANLPTYQGTFSDVAAGQWYTGFVERLAQLGITVGYPDRTFRPANPVSRADMAVFLVRAMGEEDNLPSFQGTFTDVVAGQYFTGYVERLFQLGVTAGCSTSPARYCPFDQTSRDQMASLLARAFNLTLMPPPPRTVNLRAQTVVSGLVAPVFLASPPGDDRLFILEQPGRIRILAEGSLLSDPFLAIEELVDSGGEQGLLGLAFHPDYAGNRRLFVNYTDTSGDTRIVEYLASASNPSLADPSSARILLTIDQPASNHNGGWLGFGPDGYLYLGMGDGGGANDQFGNGQDTASLLGKILRIDVDSGSPYGIPATNPFAAGGGAAEVFVYGMRNPWRAAFDGSNLYIADVGQGSWEEVDVITTTSGGANLGWNIMEGAHCFQSSTCNQTGLTLPVYEYDHGDGCSITGGYVYRGAAIPEIAGAYFLGDYCTGIVRSFRYTGSGIIDLKDWTADLGDVGRISSFGVDSAGELYIVDLGGDVFKIVRE